MIKCPVCDGKVSVQIEVDDFWDCTYCYETDTPGRVSFYKWLRKKLRYWIRRKLPVVFYDHEYKWIGIWWRSHEWYFGDNKKQICIEMSDYCSGINSPNIFIWTGNDTICF